MASRTCVICASICSKSRERVSYPPRARSNCRLACASCSSAMLYFSDSSFSSCCLRSISSRNRLTSNSRSSSFFRIYIFAFSAWRSRGATWRSNSVKISWMRTRFSRSCSSFFCAAVLRRLNLTMPAASSNSSRRSSGLPLNIRSIWP